MSEFGAWLQRELDRRELRPADFARRADVNPSMVTRWMHGTTPSPESCELIADVFGVNPDMVLTLAGHRPNIEDLDPDDPVVELQALVRRIQWQHHQPELKMIRAQLEMLRTEDRERRHMLVDAARAAGRFDPFEEPSTPLDDRRV